MPEQKGNKFIERGAHKGKGIAVFTSGGDSQVYIIKIHYFELILNERKLNVGIYFRV